MAVSRKTRRIVLAGVALALIVGNVWWFTREEPQPPQAFNLTPTFESAYVPDKQQLPLEFDPVTSSWTADGKPVSDLARHLEHRLFSYPLDRDTPEQVDAPDAFKGQALAYIPVRDDGQRNLDQMRRLLLSLSQTGICQLGIVSEKTRGAPRDSVALFGINTVRDDEGRSIPCTASS